ncbi:MULTISPECIES: helix-turn-helix transcriptional regulator [Chryseobacterium]|jgi:DNA-binding CsgD family transcriptional regulator|uniref:DNA-binding CsgD family transcriptional regulator n=1 Tax=Chryseobacterium geocarposphaerae TaxID=1416776 RepID=A0ABU1LCT5_9FLAO|nr:MULTISPECIES: helix-turn-helix transcriptional regulator [Chryseobacterium]ALR31327.1 helix-turn-helix transcriptional regulator [Chryseobacterium sp. IHB B 17019]MDR6404522.1 DNA-binding CsgD family transcriptional regulator [Chryseobacterium geocarposphaerae]MDR6698246.1 DNA-binding CsgD family transcriptional regulator [Chryseobacterium ginsenosidimutans]
MDDSEKKHPLIEVWNTYPGIRQENQHISNIPPIERIIGEMFAIGEFYYYVLNLTNSTVSHHHENILKLHGLKKYPQNLKEVIDLVHPDDIDFITKAEQKVVEKLMEIGKEHQLFLKPSYCFRMKTAAGNYELFHHQAILTWEDENKNLVQSINIHTNINHITKENPRTVLISGIGPRKDFYQIKIEDSSTIKSFREINLTKRETEILSFIVKGYSGSEISKILILSEHTVRSHRKNILAKTSSRNSKELLKKAFEWGLI